MRGHSPMRTARVQDPRRVIECSGRCDEVWVPRQQAGRRHAIATRETGKRRHKPFVRPEQFTTLIELIPEPYSTMVFVAVYTGLRVSELVGLRWSGIHEHSITIDERYCRGNWGEPKSDASKTTITVN